VPYHLVVAVPHRSSVGVFVALTVALAACDRSGVAPAPTASPVPPAISELVAQVDAARLEADVRAIEGPRNWRDESIAHLREVRDFIAERFVALGYQPSFEDVVRDGAAFPIITADLPGVRCPGAVFVLGAHYDSVRGTPGADDDASGVAAVLEVARLLRSRPPPATVRLTAFPFEEAGLVGSAQMAAKARAAAVNVVGMVSAEMLGFTRPDADFIFIGANESSGPLLDAFLAARDQYVPALPERHAALPGNAESLPDLRRSDHAPFWDNGYRALMLTDTANFRNPDYHQPGDTAATLDVAFATKNARLILAGVLTYLEQDEDGDGVPDACGG